MKKEEIIKGLPDNINNARLIIAIYSYATDTIEELEYPLDNEEINFFDIKYVPEHEKYKPLNKIKFVNRFPKSRNIIWLDPITVLRSLGDNEAFNLRKSRYIKVCSYLKEKIEIPEVTIDDNGKIKLLDGRHRICAILANCGKFEKLPFIIDKKEYNSKLDLGLLNNKNIEINSNESIIISLDREND